MKRRIAIWDLERISDREFVLCMFSGDFKKNARSAAKKARVHITVIQKKGIIYSIKGLLVRKSFIAALAAAAVLFCLLSSMVWRIDIEGADAGTRANTQKLLGELGIKRGMFISNINARALSQELLEKQSGLSWVGVKKHGMTVSIELEKGTFYEEKEHIDIPVNEPCDIAVSKDCLLYKITVENGTKLISEGNTALAGNVIVSGNGGHAKAEIMGIVWYKAEVRIQQSAKRVVPTGRIRKINSLIIFGLKIDAPSWKWLPWNWGKKDFTAYDSIYNENYAGNGRLPFGSASLIMRETRLEDVTLTAEEAEIKARTDAQAALDAAIPDNAEVLSTYGEIIEKDGALYYTASAEVLENVGVYVTPAP